MQNFTGQKISTYQIETLLHQESESAVYEATQLVPGQLLRKVAVKFFTVYDEDAFNQSMKQITAPAHPNIVPIYDFGIYGGFAYVAMMLVKGESLAQRIQIRGKLNLPETVNILTQIASALHYAHLLGFVHNNLKPANILIDEKNRPYLTDFRVMGVGRTSETMMSAATVGNADYLSPELGMGKLGDKFSDIYSLGAIAFHMLNGSPPYTAPNPFQVIMKHINDPLPELWGISETAEQVIYKAMAKDKNDRFVSAYEFQKALEALIQQADAEPTPEPSDTTQQYETLKQRLREDIAQLKNKLEVTLLSASQPITPADPAYPTAVEYRRRLSILETRLAEIEKATEKTPPELTEPPLDPYDTFPLDGFDDEAAYEPEETQDISPILDGLPDFVSELAAAEPEPTRGLDDQTQLPEGVDPLAWLEALAARQGATQGFTTEHSTIEVPEIDPNSVVIDEPGYTPSEPNHSKHQPQPAPFQPSPPPPPRPQQQEQPPMPSFPARDKPDLQRAVEERLPEFTAYFPQNIQAGQAYALMVFVLLEHARQLVENIAKGYAGMMGTKQAHATTASPIEITAGTPITLIPQVEGLKFTPAEQTLIWTPATDSHKSATFLFTTPAALQSDLKGRILVFNGVMMLGEIPITMTRVESGTAPDLSQQADLKKYEAVFASYSHRDTPVMEFFRRQRERLGQKMLVDIYDLRAGDHWADRLLQMIDESTAFQLFWSKHSADSKYCRQEWEYALQHLEQRPRFIQPVWWQDPMPTPPPELEQLHFQRVVLPPVTRARMIFGKVRNLLGG